MGIKLNLSQIDKSDLELIPGLTEKSKAQIIKDKAFLIGKAKSPGKPTDAKTLQDVKGLGAKKSEVVSQFLSLK